MCSCIYGICIITARYAWIAAIGPYLHISFSCGEEEIWRFDLEDVFFVFREDFDKSEEKKRERIAYLP